jgi:hypothetical protein
MQLTSTRTRKTAQHDLKTIKLIRTRMNLAANVDNGRELSQVVLHERIACFA